MTVTIRSTALILLFWGAAACAAQSPSDAEAAAEIRSAMQDWAAAVQAEDVARSVSFVTDDARLVPPNEPVVSGREAIEQWAREFHAAVTVEEVNPMVDSVRVAGDWAVCHGAWAMRLSVDGESMIDTTRYVTIWEREPDGSWKVAYDTWNSALPLPEGQ